MITKDNLTEVMNLITEQQVKEVMNSNTDHLGLFIDGYGNVFLESINLFKDEEREEEIRGTGGAIMDKDDFLRLFMESGSLNPFIMEYC